MTGPKLTALILFCALSILFGFLLSVGIAGGTVALLVGCLAAAGTGALIWFATTGRIAFARGFLGLGCVLVVVPIITLGGLGEAFTDAAGQAIDPGEVVTDEELSTLALQSIFASAGLVFGLVVGLILILIGGLMHKRTAAPPPLPPSTD